MDLSSAPSLWAHGTVWLLFSFLLFLKFSSSGITLNPGLLVYLVLLVFLDWLCLLFLPVPLGILCLSSACWWVLGSTAPRRMLEVDGKIVFITGCDSGFGKAAARKLDSLGFKVIASVLSLESPGAQELQKICSDDLMLIQMDLTKAEDIQKAEQLIRLKAAGAGLWALINNAGYCAHFGDAELTLMSTYRSCMEVNFFGTLELTKALLPLIRCSKGRIVTISSPAGEHSFPFLAAYGSSKAALSRVMDIFRHELMPWGVKVCVIQPASYKTGAHDNRVHWERQHQKLLANLPTEILQDYGNDYITETQSLFLKYGDTACSDFSPVIDSIKDAVMAETPRVKYYAGKRLWLLYFIGTYLPYSISDQFFKGMFLNNTVKPKALMKQQGKGVQD